MHREKVMEALWPEGNLASSTNNFHQTLRIARKVMESAGVESLLLEGGCLSLGNNGGSVVWVDVDQFESFAAAARKTRDPEDYQAALMLYKGDLLSQDPYEEWAEQRRKGLRQCYMDLLMELARLYENRQDFEAAEVSFKRLLAADQACEEAHVGLMRIYTLSGQRQQALRQYQALRAVLKEELDAEPSASSVQLYEQIRNSGSLVEAPLPVSHPVIEVHPAPLTSSHHLPAPLTSFVGRKREVAEVSVLLSTNRLVSLTGAGGMGKTRLALQVGMQVQAAFQDGAWLVELSSLNDPDLVSLIIAQALGLHEISDTPILDTLSNFLKNKRALLILDNCEHLLASCASIVETLLKNCPRLHLLITSREILNVPSECAYRVLSLPTPPFEAPPPIDQMVRSEAVQLFVERASQSSPGFVLKESNTMAVFAICRRLEGIPLALELAAARTRAMSVHQISARLDNVFQLLRGGARTAEPRQQTLQAAIDWSYNLLSPTEQLVFRRLSVFMGGWTLEAAEAICAGDGIDQFEVVNLLVELVDKSLVTLVVEEGEGEDYIVEPRYRMLEVMRLYARDRLYEVEGQTAGRDRHLRYYVELSEHKETLIRGSKQIECLHWFKTEMDNLRLALEWAQDGRVVEGMRLASALKWFWHLSSSNLEGRHWLERFLGLEARERGSQPLAPGVQNDDYLLAWSRSIDALELHYVIVGNPSGLFSNEQWRSNLAENVGICRKLGEKASRELARALNSYGFALRDAALLEESLSICREKGYVYEKAETLYYLYWVMTTGKGNVEKGQACIEESLMICLKIQDYDGIATRLWMAGYLAHLRGEYSSATELIQKAIEYYQKIGNYLGWNHSTISLVQISQDEGIIQQVERVLAQCKDVHDYAISLNAYENLINAHWSNGNYKRAENLVADARAVFSKAPPNKVVEKGYILLRAGRIAMSQGSLREARLRFQEANTYFQKGPRIGIIRTHILDALAVYWLRQGDLSRAATLLGAADDLYQTYRLSFVPRQRSEHEGAVTAIRQGLGEDAFNAAWAAGQAMEKEKAVELALADM